MRWRWRGWASTSELSSWWCGARCGTSGSAWWSAARSTTCARCSCLSSQRRLRACQREPIISSRAIWGNAGSCIQWTHTHSCRCSATTSLECRCQTEIRPSQSTLSVGQTTFAACACDWASASWRRSVREIVGSMHCVTSRDALGPLANSRECGSSWLPS